MRVDLMRRNALRLLRPTLIRYRVIRILRDAKKRLDCRQATHEEAHISICNGEQRRMAAIQPFFIGGVGD